MMKEFKITLDQTRMKGNSDFLIKTQEENNIKLLFTLLHDGEAIDLTDSTVVCYVKDPLGAVFTKNCDVTTAEEGLCEVILDSVMYSKIGNYEAELRLLIGNEINITEKFYFNAIPAIEVPPVAVEPVPTEPTPTEPDADGDGIPDSTDTYPNDPTNTPPPPDRDGDGIPDAEDTYPDDPTNTPPPNKTVALVTQDTANAAATQLRDALTAYGYTVTLFAETAVTATNLADFGLIALTRYSGYDNSDTAAIPAWYAHITSYLDGGKPLMIGKSVFGSAGIYLRSLTHVLGIGKEYADSSLVRSVYKNRTHAIDGTTGILTFGLTDDYMNLIFEVYGYSGTDIATTTSANLNQKTVIACEKGLTTTTVNSKTLNARVVWAGFLYNRYGYSADGQAYIGRMVDWLLNII